jgi:hypothetical protein
VVAAIRKWHRGECGLDERHKPFDYRWAPESAELRRLALVEAREVKERVRRLSAVLGAVPYVDCTAQLERGRAAIRGLFIVAKEGSGSALAELTMDEAAKLGSAASE